MLLLLLLMMMMMMQQWLKDEAKLPRAISNEYCRRITF